MVHGSIPPGSCAIYDSKNTTTARRSAVYIPRLLNKGFGSLLPHTYQMVPDEGSRLQRPKRCINNNQDEDSPNNTTHINFLVIPSFSSYLINRIM